MSAAEEVYFQGGPADGITMVVERVSNNTIIFAVEPTKADYASWLAEGCSPSTVLDIKTARYERARLPHELGRSRLFVYVGTS